MKNDRNIEKIREDNHKAIAKLMDFYRNRDEIAKKISGEKLPEMKCLKQKFGR